MLANAVRRSFLVQSWHKWLTPLTPCRLCACLCHMSPKPRDASMRLRFAPSPTGQLHLGGVRTALYNYLHARANNGTFILRIEDTDQSRLVAGAQEKLIEMLTWAGIQIDEGPGFGGRFGPYLQSERLDIYKEKINILLQNDTAYHCFCTPQRLALLRKDAIRRGETPKYDNKCAHLSPGELQEKLDKQLPYTVRFRLKHFTSTWLDEIYGPIAYDVASIEGDPILMKADGFPTYHFANVVDDHEMYITHVLRGMEWQVSTTKHVLIYDAFGWTPPKFAHLPLLLNKDGKKLSKRQGDIHVEYFKKQGFYPESVLNLLTSSGSGFKVKVTEGMTMTELIQQFELRLVSTHSSRVDLDRLSDLNKLHLHRRLTSDPASRDKVVEQLESFVRNKFDKPNQSANISKEFLANVLQFTKDRIHKVEELTAPEFEYLWLEPPLDPLKSVTSPPSPQLVLQVTTQLLDTTPPPTDENKLKHALRHACKEHKVKFSEAMKVVRLALSAQDEGASVAEMICTLGSEVTLTRLKRAMDFLNNT